MATSSDENLETFSVIWLYADVNVLEENIVAQQKIRSFINHLKIFDDVKQCEQHIRLMSEDDRIVLIVCGQLARDIIPRIHSLRRVVDVYFYCVDEQQNEAWSMKYSKVKYIFEAMFL